MFSFRIWSIGVVFDDFLSLDWLFLWFHRLIRVNSIDEGVTYWDLMLFLLLCWHYGFICLWSTSLFWFVIPWNHFRLTDAEFQKYISNYCIGRNQEISISIALHILQFLDRYVAIAQMLILIGFILVFFNKYANFQSIFQSNRVKS
jgi:hypothetical protein